MVYWDHAHHQVSSTLWDILTRPVLSSQPSKPRDIQLLMYNSENISLCIVEKTRPLETSSWTLGNTYRHFFTPNNKSINRQQRQSLLNSSPASLHHHFHHTSHNSALDELNHQNMRRRISKPSWWTCESSFIFDEIGLKYIPACAADPAPSGPGQKPVSSDQHSTHNDSGRMDGLIDEHSALCAASSLKLIGL